MGNDSSQFVEVRKSEKHERGLFALKDFRRGETVYSFPLGRVVSSSQIQGLSEEERDHLDKVGEDEYEIIQSPLCYVNHSCDPDIEEALEGRARVGYALRDIKRGGELTVDYDKTTYLEKPFECHCGSKNCRGLVRGKR